ncbi:MAG: flavodoxin family protein [Candidatus Bathyarchaeia archaeon]
MKTIVLYFSRTGNTKRMAEAIAEATKATIFNIASAEPSIVENYDCLILGTPVEAFNPARETMRFVKRLPKAEGKKAILFCTYKLWKGNTFKVLEREISSKGYKVILCVSKKGIKPDRSLDFAEELDKIKKALS